MDFPDDLIHILTRLLLFLLKYLFMSPVHFLIAFFFFY